MSDEQDDEPYENTFSLEDLRKEVRRQWDSRNALVKALKELPEIPDWRVLKLLSHAAKFPEDGEIGKGLQRQHGFDAIAPKVEYEMGAGLWHRLRAGLIPDADRLALYETALRTLQEAAAGYVHPERRVSAEELADLVLAVVDDGELVRAMRTSEPSNAIVDEGMEEGK